MTEREQKILRAYENGMQIKDIYTEFRTNPVQLYKLLRANNVSLRNSPVVIKKSGKYIHNPYMLMRAKKMWALKQKGMSLADIGSYQNPPITRERVRQILKLAGYVVKDAPVKRPVPKNIQDAMKAYQEGMLSSDIQEQYGVNHGQLHFWRRKLGIKPRRFIRPDTMHRGKKLIDAYYNDSRPLADVCAEFGLPPNAASQLIRRLGLPQTRKGNRGGLRDPMDVRQAKFRELMATGKYRPSAAAREVGYTETYGAVLWRKLQNQLAA